jgi:stearoyl-CoA desaturase (delta-9 desaturase)
MNLILYTLLVTHITIVSVTLYLHRGQAHRGVIFHPTIAHFFRFWLWLTTGMVTKQWVAIHRKHHRYSDVEGDPHSPHVFGIRKLLTQGALLYSRAAQDKDMVEKYGVGTPDDWIERNLYNKYNFLGITLLFLVNLLCFSWWGLVVWAVQMLWIPFWAAGVINGLGHWWGYRNGESKDKSRNISPWGIIIGGEELHNNHHLSPASVRLSRRWFEFDIGWMYITILKTLKLATVTDRSNTVLETPQG